MKEASLQRLLAAHIETLNRALPSFERSLAKCALIPSKDRLSFEEEECFDALTSKFSRIADIYCQKVLKSLVLLLREDAPTFIDRANLCEKLSIIPSAEHLVAIRDLRNTIAHEYITENLIEVYRDTVTLAPALLTAIAATRTFIEQRDLTHV